MCQGQNMVTYVKNYMGHGHQSHRNPETKGVDGYDQWPNGYVIHLHGPSGVNVHSQPQAQVAGIRDQCDKTRRLDKSFDHDTTGIYMILYVYIYL